MNLITLSKISYGVYIVSSSKDIKFNGQIANTVFQISSEPAIIAISINKQNLTHEYINKSKIFSVSILSKETPIKFIGQFGFKSGRDIDKFKEVNHKIGKTGVPVVLEFTVGYLEAEVINSIDVETHTVFVGKIVDAEIINNEEPLTYAEYHDLKKGLTPASAPTYIKEDKVVKGENKKMSKYKCTVCGYIYDPEKGDSDGGIKPGTSFEDLLKEWVCPVCGVGKDQFEVL